MNEFKPGDVVVHPEYGRGIVQAKGWVGFVGYDKALTAVAADLRRLVVIDTEDREQVKRLLDLYYVKVDDGSIVDLPASLQAALREFANPKPPKPEEPLAIGAIVEDSRGGKWVRLTHHGGSVWRRAAHGESLYFNYGYIDAVRVLSEGVQP